MDSLGYSDSSSLLRNIPLTVHYEDVDTEYWHPVYVIATIENHYNNGLYGGATGVDGISYYAGDVENGVEWLKTTRGCNVINNSWGVQTYMAGGQYWANRISRLFDIEASANNYITFVASAGNSASGTENDDCKNYDPADRWTETTCQECYGWSGHNTILVGAFNDNSRTRASFSSWRNDPTHYDEYPHVMAPGDYVRFPNGVELSGTSFSAPAITALIADMQSANGTLREYPEMAKAVLMASAHTTPAVGDYRFNLDESYEEMYGGAGCAKGGRALAMLSNWSTGDISVTGCGSEQVSGCKSFLFSSNESDGAQRSFKLICNRVCPGWLDVYLSWCSNPEGTLNIGDRQECDDIDLTVSGNGQTVYSITSQNSTEAIVIYHSGSPGVVEYTITAELWGRITNKTIYCAVAVSASSDM